MALFVMSCMNRKTIILGASPNPARYAYTAVSRLVSMGEEVIAIGIRKGEINGIEIQPGQPLITDVDTVSLYLNPGLQEQYIDYILSLHPKRVIFNPGTENVSFMKRLRAMGIETLAACTLVMLSSGEF